MTAILKGVSAGLLCLLLAACSQAGHPSATGQALASGSGTSASATTGGTGGATGSIVALIAGGTNLTVKFPTMARLQLSITGAAELTGVPQQVNLPLGGQSIPLTLPTGVPLTLTFDVFDAAGTYLGTGTSITTLQINTRPTVSVNVLPVASGTPYVDPVTGLTGAGPVFGLSVSVVSGAGNQPVAGAIVSLGASGTATATTNASGIASFTSFPSGTDVHVFSGGNAVSVLAFTGTSLSVPMPETTAVAAVVQVNPTAGPQVTVNELVDVYLTDGMNLQSIGGLLGDKTATFSSGTITPMRGPVAVTAMVENPSSTEPRPDLGILSGVALNGHSSVSPVNLTLADPKVQTLLTTVGQSITVAATPAGLTGVLAVSSDVYALQTNGAWQITSHKGNAAVPANQVAFTMWPATASSYVRHVKVSDSTVATAAAYTEEWQRTNPPLGAASFTAPALAPAPTVNTASATAVSWLDNGAPPTWSGYRVDLSQAGRLWRIFGFAAGTSVTLPAVPAAATAPIQAGVNTQAQVAEFVLNAASGFSATAPDLWFLPRQLDSRATSTPLTYVP
ncbi:MAG: hypothetical protein COS82_11575 [Zetaproteobacteria bacterium CG06_land_8_20_14_3_00_59_53]|nr:MAG: hypothetical protein AUK36_00755 [Zetaproteobacteria bacterium CG2_30_59_37]PIO90132.1 MAG: hypothetical protein COX56_04780 [Zetaproteobacteria bacterium CG23_combo_of_CG06-09_8_20_14_all_59_86]PIQ64853.1 MAG: hypothetical protein COV97_07250 [Zetaproteobacteria bacterium CG11_big_fil_rev_8_21_14_0_20_59_439]PIU69532.1 MAG: hypothetical protein COS82_11575 [Zetaproteobacteria bacterium CG06_land_8_20_14_3_00_59_53]PIU96714.1 MAG: hypothetical protein COS62_06825 [Zetaproteobacteria bac